MKKYFISRRIVLLFIKYNKAFQKNNSFRIYIKCNQILGGEFMEISELINLIANVGFPVAISAYLLIRLENQILTLTFSINKLNTIISTKLGVVIDNE